jgi:hypothetical protein
VIHRTKKLTKIAIAMEVDLKGIHARLPPVAQQIGGNSAAVPRPVGRSAPAGAALPVIALNSTRKLMRVSGGRWRPIRSQASRRNA